MQSLQSMCSHARCNEPATMTVTYKQVNSKPEEVRSLCGAHYEAEDEAGIKYYQIGIKSLKLLN